MFLQVKINITQQVIIRHTYFPCVVLWFLAVTYIYCLVFIMQNSTGGMNQDCVAAYSKTNETWKCGLADVSLVYMTEVL